MRDRERQRERRREGERGEERESERESERAQKWTLNSGGGRIGGSLAKGWDA
jgi:hypothetical protein